jgi:hypothetical protein
VAEALLTLLKSASAASASRNQQQEEVQFTASLPVVAKLCNQITMSEAVLDKPFDDFVAS